MPENSDKKLRFGVFEFDAGREELRKQGLRIKLQGQPLLLLSILLEHPGEIVTREELQARVWDQGVFVDFDHSLNKAISKIREALGDSPESPRFVETLSRRGYRFIAPIQVIEDSLPALSPRSESSPQGASARESAERSTWLTLKTWAVHRRKPLFAITAIFVLAFALIPSWFRTARAHPNYAIAVLPFENVGNVQDNEYLSDGLEESVIHALCHFRELRVMSRNSSSRYKGRNFDASTVGRELGVGAILAGRVRTVGDTIRVTVELVDAADNHSIWGEKFERKSTELAGIEDEIAAQTARNLRLQAPSPHVMADTRNSEAYRLYLEGNYNLSKQKEENTLRAIQLFERALQNDPRYALAWTGLAIAYNKLPYFGTYPAAETFNKAKAAATRALELDPDLSEAHNALASIREDFDWDWDGAESEYRKAIQLNPSNGLARHWYSHFLSRMGRHEEGIAEAKRAVEVDPLSPSVLVNLAASYVFAGQYDEAIDACRRAISLDPNFPDAHYTLGISYREKGLYKDSIDEFRRQIATDADNKYAIGFLGYSYGLSGQRREAEKTIEQLKSTPDVSPLALALVYVGLQKDQAALQLLDKAFEAHDPYVRYLKVDPCFARLRSNARFHELLRRAKLDTRAGASGEDRS